MSTYIKKQHKNNLAESPDGQIADGWAVYDTSDSEHPDLIAVVDTEGLADVLVNSLAPDKPAYVAAAAPKPTRQAFFTTIQLVVTAVSEGYACDGLSELLRGVTEQQTGGFLVDWQYVGRQNSMSNDLPPAWQTIQIPVEEDFEEGEVFSLPATKQLTHPIDLDDAYGSDRRLSGHIRAGSAVEIDFAGYGLKDCEPGHGPVVLIENQRGVPVLYVWPDIRDAEPMKISLEKAAETLRDN